MKLRSCNSHYVVKVADRVNGDQHYRKYDLAMIQEKNTNAGEPRFSVMIRIIEKDGVIYADSSWFYYTGYCGHYMSVADEAVIAAMDHDRMVYDVIDTVGSHTYAGLYSEVI